MYYLFQSDDCISNLTDLFNFEFNSNISDSRLFKLGMTRFVHGILICVHAHFDDWPWCKVTMAGQRWKIISKTMQAMSMLGSVVFPMTDLDNWLWLDHLGGEGRVASLLWLSYTFPLVLNFSFNLDYLQIAEFTKECSAKWREMVGGQKKPFDDLAAKDKARYDKEVRLILKVCFKKA